MNTEQTQNTRETNPVYAAWVKMRGNMPLAPMQFARHAFDAIAAGEPTTVAKAAKALGITEAEAKEHVETIQGWGLMNLEGDAIVGSLGLTTQPTQYQVELDGRSLHVWCALDAVGIPAALGTDASIKVDGLADVQIRKGKLEAAEPSTLRISLNDPYMASDMKAEICPTISFHEAAGDAHESLFWMTVDDAMELGKIIWERPAPENTQ